MFWPWFKNQAVYNFREIHIYNLLGTTFVVWFKLFARKSVCPLETYKYKTGQPSLSQHACPGPWCASLLNKRGDTCPRTPPPSSGLLQARERDKNERKDVPGSIGIFCMVGWYGLEKKYIF